MAKGKKTGGRDFEPGNKFGKGNPPLPPEIRAMKNFTKAEIEATLCEFLRKPYDELVNMVIDKQDAPALELMIASIIVEGIRTGDRKRLDFIFDRIVGKVPLPVDFSLHLGRMSNDQLLEASKEAIKIIEVHNQLKGA